MRRVLAGLLTVCAICASGAETIPCEGVYGAHLQGVAADREAIYWSFTTTLVKTDFKGKRLASVNVAWHHGDLCVHDGKVYVAVDLGPFNRRCPPGKNFVYEYRAADLAFVKRYPVDEMIYGAGGIEYADGSFYVVGGLPDTEKANLICEYTPEFKFKRRILLPGWTRKGIQTACFAQGKWFFGTYDKEGLKVCDAQFRELAPAKRRRTSVGMAVMPDGRIAVGYSKHLAPKGAKPRRDCGGVRLFTLLPDGSLEETK